VKRSKTVSLADIESRLVAIDAELADPEATYATVKRCEARSKNLSKLVEVVHLREQDALDREAVDELAKSNRMRQMSRSRTGVMRAEDAPVLPLSYPKGAA
jgi:hypothetical protein